jgi:transcriptional regulator with XRE-family HTH domain
MANVNRFLGKRLKALRGEQSLYQVGKEARVSRSNLSSYEEGLHLPTDEVLQRLAEYYQVSYEELRILYYADYYGKFPLERSIVLAWAEKVLQGEKF